MYKYNNAKVAKESAQEHNLHYGMSALDGKWYVGSPEELKKAGCADIDRSEGKMSKAMEIVNMMEQEEEEDDTKYYDKGTYVMVRPTGKSVQAEYPAAKWLKKEQKVKLLDDAVEGTADVFDVELEDGTEESVYGFNIFGEA